ncbi:MAG: Hsp20/alpha crystallin family protein [Candidatus Paceibacterota bacterium]
MSEEKKEVINKDLKEEENPKEIELGEHHESLEKDFKSEGQLTVDVYHDEDNVIVESTVAGVDPDEIEVNITNDSVTIKGRRKREKKIEDKDFYYQELFWGDFSRTIILPHDVDPEESEASFSNGVLVVTMPIFKKKKAKKVKVKAE